MLEFDAFHFVRYIEYLNKLHRDISSRENELLDEKERQNLIHLMYEYRQFFANYGMDISGCANRIESKLLRPGQVITKLSSLLLELRNRISDELKNRLFMFIPIKQAEYHEQPALFGIEVAEKFPKANKELTEAGNCYAAGNNTACVFHLMRAVELGVRPLVKNLKVNLSRPVELCEWGQLVGGLEDAIKQLPKRTSVAASARSEFYSHAVAQFRNFKDAWRNHVAHTRTSYDEYQAMSVMVNAKHFFEHIATRLKE
jgi:hypothetical protein